MLQNIAAKSDQRTTLYLDCVSRSNLRHGAVFMLVGLVFGIIVPQTPYPRLALGAHIQLTGSGIMFLVAGLVIAHLNLGARGFSRFMLLATPWIIWPMALSEVANAWWGTSKMLAIVAHEGGAIGAAPWKEAIVAITHIVASLFIIAYWGIILWGIRCKPAGTTEA